MVCFWSTYESLILSYFLVFFYKIVGIKIKSMSKLTCTLFDLTPVCLLFFAHDKLNTTYIISMLHILDILYFYYRSTSF
uniref:Uncharacterized protein n=1 Tax=Oryza brachyantha TaxID=4533 RepID=J3MDL8_ORYBR